MVKMCTCSPINTCCIACGMLTGDALTVCLLLLLLPLTMPNMPYSLQVSIRFDAPFAPTCMCHPDTYLNKVVVGGADGSLQLWNFVTGQLVHTFAGW